ncbi:MAG: hypothetical protein SFU21_10105 [Flavihumibacter sp.]|nr:hypothetical protein [Flavihumibacter sp.]
MKIKILKWLWVPGAIVGAMCGYLYWKWVGCNTGTCMITSKPLNSTLYFAVVGALVFSLFTPSKKKDTTATSNSENE